MLKFLRGMSAGKLFASWIVYWILLIAVGLRSAIGAIWRVSGAAPGQGSASLGFNDGAFSINVIEAGKTIYSGSIHVLPLTLLVAGPPLVLWLLWFASRSRRSSPDAVAGR